MKARRSIARSFKSFLPEWLVGTGRRLLWSLMPNQRSVSINYKIVSSDVETATSELRNAWKDWRIPKAQRAIVNTELERMYQGDVIPIYHILADAIMATGCDNGKIIEVGCASGYYYEVLRHLLGHEIHYMGIDYSRALIAEARRHYPSISFVVGDATALPLPNGLIDVLISGGVLPHVPDYRKAIAECARVTREWVIFHRTPVVLGPTIHYTKLAYGVRCLEFAFGEKELLDLFQEHGLTLVTALEISYGKPPLTSYQGYSRTYVCKKVS